LLEQALVLIGEAAMLEELIGQKVVIDMKSTYVCLGTLLSFDEHHLQLKNADIHDLRDTQTSRENYIAQSVTSGIKRNRKRAWVVRADMVAVARLDDFVDD
jgi:small nuclear ribonucleoprotein (snRNP)-like protein